MFHQKSKVRSIAKKAYKMIADCPPANSKLFFVLGLVSGLLKFTGLAVFFGLVFLTINLNGAMYWCWSDEREGLKPKDKGPDGSSKGKITSIY